MKHKILMTAIGAAMAVGSTAANAYVFGAPIGISFAGTGAGFIYADLWTERTDTGVDINPNGSGVVFMPGDVHTFQSQHRVGTFQDDGNPVFAPLDPQAPGTTSYEITQLVKFDDQVEAFVPNGTGGGLVTFEYRPDAYTNMSIYLDNLDDGSRATPGPDGGTVNCYGAGVLGGAACPKLAGLPGIDGDGTLIMEWNLIANTSSFSSSVPGAGTGSADLIFELTYFNPLFVDVSLLGAGKKVLRMTNTITQPLGGTPRPDAMWNGVSPSADVMGPNQIFKIDGSKDFGSMPIPEPASLALLGIGLAGVGFSRRRK